VDAICDHVLARTVTQQATHDDVALLVVRLLEQSIEPLQLTLPARPESIPLARHRLRDWLTTNVPRLEQMSRGELELAWTEACTNVVLHAYERPDETFVASAVLEPGAVCLEISDHGRWRGGGDREGGRGLPLIRQLCDELDIDRRANGTVVKMRRLLGADQDDDRD
jgi:anti-sigma regulatory factor (Ser/Thr protein kinase)